MSTFGSHASAQGTDSWVERAKCRHQDSEKWVTENLPKGPNRELAAQKLCNGCEVVRECADFAVEHEVTGMVYAGIPLSEYGSRSQGSVNLRYYERLCEIAGRKPPGPKRLTWPRNCKTCGRSMHSPTVPPPAVHYTVRGFNRDLCRPCKDRIRGIRKFVPGDYQNPRKRAS